MALLYDPQRLDRKAFFDEQQIEFVMELNSQYTLEQFLNNRRFVEAFGIDFIHASAQIEGNTYTLLETQELLLRGQTAAGKQFSDARMIINLRKAFDRLLTVDYTVNEDFVLDLHTLVAKGELDDKDLGRPRKEAVAITGTEYAPPQGEQYLKEEFKYLVATSSRIDSVLDRAVYLHLNLAYLQYFIDGNKRTARMVQSAAMMEKNIIPLFFRNTAVKDYLSSVIEYYETGNPQSYVDWFTSNYEEMFKKILPPTLPLRSMKSFE